MLDSVTPTPTLTGMADHNGDTFDLHGLFDVLFEQPFDDRGSWQHEGVRIETSPEGHVAVLSESEELDDDDGARAEAAAEALEEEAAAYERQLAEAWGTPREFDAFPHVRQAPPPALAMLLLEHGAGAALLWERQELAAGLATAQLSEESPIRLLAFVSSRAVG